MLGELELAAAWKLILGICSLNSVKILIFLQQNILTLIIKIFVLTETLMMSIPIFNLERVPAAEGEGASGWPNKRRPKNWL